MNTSMLPWLVCSIGIYWFLLQVSKGRNPFSKKERLRRKLLRLYNKLEKAKNLLKEVEIIKKILPLLPPTIDSFLEMSGCYVKDPDQEPGVRWTRSNLEYVLERPNWDRYYYYLWEGGKEHTQQ